MSNTRYTVYWDDKSSRDFEGPSALVAYIRALSYSLVTRLNKDISYIVDNKNAKIYHNWFWDVSYSEEEKDFNPHSEIKYSEHEVEELFEEYVRYTGNSPVNMRQWLDRNKKK